MTATVNQVVAGVVGTSPETQSSTNLFQASPYGTIFPCFGDSIELRIAKIGTPTADCTVEIWFAPDDPPTSFGVGATLTNAQITSASVSGGFAIRIPAAGRYWRSYLNAGTMTGANGFAVIARS